MNQNRKKKFTRIMAFILVGLMVLPILIGAIAAWMFF